MTTIKLKNGSGAPTAGDLVQGEPALDLTNKRLYTEDSGGTVIEVGTNPGTDVTFADNRKAIFGAGSDLQIYHDGSNSFMGDFGTGDLYLRASTNLYIGNSAGSASFITAADGGAVDLRYNGSAKLATTSTGIDVTGDTDTSGLFRFGVNNSEIANNYLRFKSSGTGFFDHNTVGQAFNFRVSASSALDTTPLVVNSSGIDVTGTVTADGLTVDGGTTLTKTGTNASPHIKLTESGDTREFNIFNDGSGNGRLVLADTDDTPDSEIVLADNGILQFKTANSERMTITSAGNVGIGTTSPQASLSLASSTSDSNGIKMQASGWPHYVRSGINGTTGSQFIQSTNWNAATNTVDSSSHATTALILDTSSGSIQFRTETTNTVPTERMRIDSSGNVGVGTSSPDTLLHLSDTAGGAVIRLERNDTSIVSTDVYGEIQFEGQDSSAGSAAGIRGKILGVAEGATGEMALAFQTASGYGSSTERMRIDAAGRVGIGCSPDFPLHVSSTGVVLGLNATSGAVSQRFNENGTARFFLSTLNGSNGLAFVNGDGVSERMRIDSSGNLLVGTTDPIVYNEGSTGNSGVVIHSDNYYSAARKNGSTLFLNRQASDGNIAQFYKDGSSVGIVATRSSGISIGNTSRGILFSGDTIYPENPSTLSLQDATINLGASASRFKDLYLSGVAYASYVGSSGDTDTSIAFDTANSIRFSTAGSEAARFDSSGNLLVGTTSGTGYKIRSVATGSDRSMLLQCPNGGANVVTLNTSGTADYSAFLFTTDGGNTQTGSIVVGASSTTYNTSSDQRLKDNIVDAPSASDDIDAIQVRSFDWKADGSHQKYGMVAQELQSVAPEAVTGDADSDDMMGVDYSKLVPMLVKEIQSLRARVAQLEGEN